MEGSKVREELVGDAEGVGLAEKDGQQLSRGKGVAAVVIEAI